MNIPRMKLKLVFLVVSGQQLRCDVIVDVIDAIDIETTTRELYLEDSPEQFILRGLDDEGKIRFSDKNVLKIWIPRYHRIQLTYPSII